MKIFEKESFGCARSGETVRAFCLEGGSLRAEVLTYGATLRTLETRDRESRRVDIALGYDTLHDYEIGDKYLGAVVGRCANRIANGRFTLDGTVYELKQNDGTNHLHGGQRGFSDRVWTPSVRTDGLHLTLESPDGEEGYPGKLNVEVVYAIEEHNALSISYRASCDQNTVCNLTNHTYFNLAGAGHGSILPQEVQLFSDFYTPVDANMLPYGAVEPVEGTPMDFREPQALGARIDGDFVQLRRAGGYDHNWVVRGQPGELRPAARAICKENGVVMEVWTTQPGVQLYTANFLEGGPAGKGGTVYPNRAAFCLETQAFPNAMSCPSFPQPILRKGEVYRHKTVFMFKTLA